MPAGRCIAATALLLLGSQPAAAQDVAPFYKGKTVTVMVGSSAGGGYDLYDGGQIEREGGTERRVSETA